MRNTIRFILAGQIEEVSDCDPTTTVLDYLRDIKGLKGTKEGCAEGDCGACTVVLGELHDGGIRYRAVNSCIQFLPTLDGKQVLTVEDLDLHQNLGEGSLHPVQQAMVDQHGSQCGFCTPGFVMSLFAMFHHQPEKPISRADIDLGLAGNLCRCTGYAPIVKAAEQALTANRTDWLQKQESQYLEQLQTIAPSETLETGDGQRRYFSPCSADELCDLLRTHPDTVMVAGATDVGLWVTKKLQSLETVIYLGAIKELAELHNNPFTDSGGREYCLRIGATVSYTDAIPAITCHYPGFRTLIERLGAAQVRNAGTIGGNIANGSPIADMPPGLIAIDTSLVLRSSEGRRQIELEDFFLAYGKQDLRAGEYVEQILLPAPVENQVFATYKITKRFEQDISAVCAAFSVEISNGIVMNARVCFGGMAEIPKRATACEKALNGNSWNQQTIEQAMKAMLNDFTPITDMRASAQYRMQVAQNLLRRFYLEQVDTAYPVRLGGRHGELYGQDVSSV